MPHYESPPPESPPNRSGSTTPTPVPRPLPEPPTTRVRFEGLTEPVAREEGVPPNPPLLRRRRPTPYPVSGETTVDLRAAARRDAIEASEGPVHRPRTNRRLNEFLDGNHDRLEAVTEGMRELRAHERSPSPVAERRAGPSQPTEINIGLRPPRLTRALRDESTELASLGDDPVRRRLVYLSEFFVGTRHANGDRDHNQYTTILNGIFTHDTNGRWGRFYVDVRTAHMRLLHLTEEEAEAEQDPDAARLSDVRAHIREVLRNHPYLAGFVERVREDRRRS